MNQISSQKIAAIIARVKEALHKRGLPEESIHFFDDSPNVLRWLVHTIEFLFKPSDAIAHTTLVITSPEGSEKLPCRYMIVDAKNLIPSHIPTDAGLLQKNSKYPDNLQERSYEGDIMEAEKVRNNLRQFFPPLVINTNPDAVNGPPVADRNLVVLGGNSRAMTMQLMYKQSQHSSRYREIQAKYISYLIERSLDFGLTIGDVLAVQQPILIRVLDLDTMRRFSEAQRLVRLLNESLTQKMSYTQELTAIARSIPREGWNKIAKVIALTMDVEDSTFNEYMQTPKATPLIDTLRQFGVFSLRNFSVYFDQENKALNRLGRFFVKDILLGRVFHNHPEQIAKLTDSQFDLFSDLAPFLIASSCCDLSFDILSDLMIAVQAADYMKNAKHTENRQQVLTYPSFVSIRKVAQFNLFYQIPPEFDDAQKTVRRRFLWQLFFDMGTKRRYLMRGFQRYAIHAALRDELQGGLALSSEELNIEPESANSTILWAFQAKRWQQETTADAAEFELAEQNLLENASTHQQGLQEDKKTIVLSHKDGILTIERTIRGKRHVFSYFDSYTQLVQSGQALTVDSEQARALQPATSTHSAQGLRLLNPQAKTRQERLANAQELRFDPRAAAWEVSRR